MEQLKQSIKNYNEEYGFGNKLPRLNKNILINFIINIDNDKIFCSNDKTNYNERNYHNDLKKNGKLPLLKNGKISKSKLSKMKMEEIANYVNYYIRGNLEFVELIFID